MPLQSFDCFFALFDEIKHRHTLNEVGDVAEGAYDWKIEKDNSKGMTR